MISSWLSISFILVNPALKLGLVTLVFAMLDHYSKYFQRSAVFRISLLWLERLLSLFYYLYLCGFRASNDISNSLLAHLPSTLTWILAMDNQGNGVFLFIIGAILSIVFILIMHDQDNRSWRICIMQCSSALGILFSADISAVVIYLEILALLSAYAMICHSERDGASNGMMYFLVHLFGSLLMITGVMLYTLTYGHSHVGHQWFTSGTWYGNLCCEIFLIGLLLNIGIPPLISPLMKTYAALRLPTQLSTLVSFKVLIFILMDIFLGHKLLLYLGIIILLYVAIQLFLESRPTWLVIYLAVGHLGIDLCHLAHADKALMLPVMLDICNTTLAVVGMLILIRIATSIEPRIQDGVGNMFLLLRCWQGRLLILLMLINLYLLVVVVSIAGRLSHIDNALMDNMRDPFIAYASDIGHLLLLFISLKFLLGSCNFWRHKILHAPSQDIITRRHSASVWYAYGLLFFIYWVWNIISFFAGSLLGLPPLNRAFVTYPDLDIILSVAFYLGIISVIFYRFGAGRQLDLLTLHRCNAILHRMVDLLKMMILGYAQRTWREIRLRLRLIYRYCRNGNTTHYWASDNVPLPNAYKIDWALGCLFVMLIFFISFALLVIRLLPI